MTALGDTMKNPYTPDEIFNLINQPEEDNHDYVLMDPKRVQASVESALLKGFDHGEKHQIEYAKSRNRERVAMFLMVFAIVFLLLSAARFVVSFLPPPDQSTVPHFVE